MCACTTTLKQKWNQRRFARTVTRWLHFRPQNQCFPGTTLDQHASVGLRQPLFKTRGQCLFAGMAGVATNTRAVKAQPGKEELQAGDPTTTHWPMYRFYPKCARIGGATYHRNATNERHGNMKFPHFSMYLILGSLKSQRRMGRHTPGQSMTFS